jgi:predicted ATPase
MASWQTLHLEPSVMRTPDKIGGPSKVDDHGGHVAATLARLIADEKGEGRTLAQVTNSLAALVADLDSLDIDRDESRQQLTVMARMKGCSRALGPRSLSDGTLRFLALVAMEADRKSTSVLCMEEPENGMHPMRVQSIVNLLREFIVDADFEIEPENPLRA